MRGIEVITELTVMKAKYGDDEAFSKLYEEIYVDLYRTAYYMLKNKDDAEDAVSEAVVDMYRDICKIKKTGAFKAWAMRILWVKCKNRLKEYCNKTEELEAQGELSGKCDLERDTVLKNDLDKAMACLSEEERIMVICSAVWGMNSSQISDVTGLARGTIRSKLSRALKKVRAELEEYV